MYYNNYYRNYDFDSASASAKASAKLNAAKNKFKAELKGYKDGVKSAFGELKSANSIYPEDTRNIGKLTHIGAARGLGGGILGAGIGALAGHYLGDTSLGTAIGAGSGALLGASTVPAKVIRTNIVGKKDAKRYQGALKRGAITTAGPRLVYDKQMENVYNSEPEKYIINTNPNGETELVYSDVDEISSSARGFSQQVNRLLALKRLARLSGVQDFSSINDLEYRLYNFYC